MSTLTITEFLEARIAEAEREAQSALALRGSGTHWRIGHPLDPARVLAECAAKRAVITSYASCKGAEAATDITKEFGVKLTVSGMVKGLELAVRHLAAVYADHADYRPEWAL